MNQLHILRARLEALHARYKAEKGRGLFTRISKDTDMSPMKISQFYNGHRALNLDGYIRLERAVSKLERKKDFAK